MKRIKTYINIAGLFFLCSCNRAQEIITESGDEMCLSARLEQQTDTKTILRPDKSVIWDVAEEIKVFCGYRSSKFTSQNQSPAAEAQFQGRFLSYDDDDEIWALYPYDKGATFSGDAITTKIPADQVACAGTFARNMNVSIARSIGTDLQFYNVCGGIRFSLVQEGVTKIVFESLNGEKIAGTVKVGFGGDEKPEIKEVTDGTMFITLSPPSGESFIPGEMYYIVAIPGTLEKGFKMRFYQNDVFGRRSSDKCVTLKRSVYGSLANADSNLEYEPIMSDFPETGDEIAAAMTSIPSVASTTDKVIQCFRAMDSNQEIDASLVAMEMSKIDGVVKAKETSTGDVALLLNNGIWANVVVNSTNNIATDTDFVSTNQQTNAVPFDPQFNYGPTVQTATTKSMIISSGKKAILLYPLVDEEKQLFSKTHPSSVVEEMYDQKERYLKEAGFEVDRYDNNKATLDKFRGDNLEKYDVVFITTHGSCDAVSLDGRETTAFQTASSVDDFVDSLSDLPSEQQHEKARPLSIFVIDGSSYFCLTALGLEADNPSFNNTWFYANTCSSYATNDMASVVLSHGAAAYSGNKDWAGMWETNVISSFFVKQFTHGYEFDEAVNRTKKYVFDPIFGWDLSRDISLLKNRRRTGDLFYLVDTEPIDKMAPVLSLSTKGIPFENTEVGFTKTNCFTITNSGSAELVVNSISVSGHIFSIDKKSCALAPNESVDIKVSFSPTGPATFRGDIIIHSNCSNTHVNSIYLVGLGVPATRKAIDLGLSVKWATCNVGATKPEEYGDYYAWGETKTKSNYDWSTYKWCNGSNTTMTKYCTNSSYGKVDNKTVLESDDDVAHVEWGGSWRMPTDAEWTELRENCTWVWTTLGGVNGRLITSNKKGYTDKSIFLPAAGYRRNTNMGSDGYSGFYLSSTLNSDRSDGAWYVKIASTDVGRFRNARLYGQSVRPVSE